MPADAGFHIIVSSDGDVTRRDLERAEESLARTADVVPGRVLHGELRLSMAKASSPAPARTRPAKVEGALDVDGRLVRAQVAAPTIGEAIDRFTERLRSRVREHAERLSERGRANQDLEPGQWRRGDPPTERPSYFDRPREERQLIRRKSFAAPSSTPEEALFDMETLDHDFFLFRNAESGQANVVYRMSDGGYGLIQPTGGAGSADVGVAPIRLSAQLPPTLPSDEAVTALNVSNQAFLFFVDADDGEGAVLYRRYDGHYGLITLDDAR